MYMYVFLYFVLENTITVNKSNKKLNKIFNKFSRRFSTFHSQGKKNYAIDHPKNIHKSQQKKSK